MKLGVGVAEVEDTTDKKKQPGQGASPNAIDWNIMDSLLSMSLL
jgi:hypothetical protein